MPSGCEKSVNIPGWEVTADMAAYVLFSDNGFADKGAVRRSVHGRQAGALVGM